ncbi:MAG: 4'-phosphopantetheinyl transferase family protein [Sulfuricaulis sp.]
MNTPSSGEFMTREASDGKFYAAAATRQVAESVVNARHARHENPASYSPLLASLFPAGIVAAELRKSVDPSLLFPNEAQNLKRAVPKRIQEFTAGRLCARRALEKFGITDYPLTMNSNHQPHWPASYIGSISHITGMCGAVVAQQSRFRAIGLDMEIVGHVTPEIWPYICTPVETAWLATLHGLEQARCAALIFSAKESFYKCQYGVTQQWLEFGDVSLDLISSEMNIGCFVLRPRRRINLLEHDDMPWIGRFRFHGNLVATGVTLEMNRQNSARF